MFKAQDPAHEMTDEELRDELASISPAAHALVGLARTVRHRRERQLRREIAERAGESDAAVMREP